MPTSAPDIADLISRTALRDRQAFRDLYQRTSAKLFGVTLRILKDRAEAEEALQEVYVKIWQRADRYAVGGYSPISWLVAVARNHALDILRARRPVADDIDAALEVAGLSPNPEQATIGRGERARGSTAASANLRTTGRRRCAAPTSTGSATTNWQHATMCRSTRCEPGSGGA